MNTSIQGEIITGEDSESDDGTISNTSKYPFFWKVNDAMHSYQYKVFHLSYCYRILVCDYHIAVNCKSLHACTNNLYFLSPNFMIFNLFKLFKKMLVVLAAQHPP